ncbi:hypothetical protein HAX54_051538, partial [Datura stramonium]|nr:hypothetical protein [Datura stramonium]
MSANLWQCMQQMNDNILGRMGEAEQEAFDLFVKIHKKRQVTNRETAVVAVKTPKNKGSKELRSLEPANDFINNGMRSRG